jgi:hypothetical protein
MHRTGLWHNRYNVFTEPAMRARERSSEVQAVKKTLEGKQDEYKKDLAANHPGFENELNYNYRALQIFDLLSLYFCCDGYASEDQFKEYKIAPVMVAYDRREQVELRLLPNGVNSVRFDPYPFDIAPLKVSVRARVMTIQAGLNEEAGLAAYQKAPRQMLQFELAR